MYRFEEKKGIRKKDNRADPFTNDEIRMLYDKKLPENSKSAVFSLHVSYRHRKYSSVTSNRGVKPGLYRVF